MAGVKRISREEIERIGDQDDPWKIVMRPEKRRKVAATEDLEQYIYPQALDEFDSRLSFQYSVTLYDQLVDWRKKGKGPDAFRTYSKFQIEDTDLEVGDIVFVNFGDPDASPTPDADGAETEALKQPGQFDATGDATGEPIAATEIEQRQEPIPDWVAKVLECRAFDQEHVFLRVLWLYRPEDLPSGRQPWHGWNELFPSNAMQIIDAMTVSGKAGPLIKWNEKEDQRTQDYDGLIWRQTRRVRTKKGKTEIDILGKLKTYCTCKQPANPEGDLVRCKACGASMHDKCIEEAAVKQAVLDEKKGHDSVLNPDPDTVTENPGAKTPARTNTFNSVTDAVNMIVHKLKRGTTPSKASKQKDIAGSDENADVAVNDVPPPKTKVFTARIVGLDGEDKDVPLRVEIMEHIGDGEGRSVAKQKIHCLFCAKDVE